MSNIKVKIAGHECTGTVMERSYSTASSSKGGSVRSNFVIVDLDSKCVLSDSSPTPQSEIEVRGAWKPAKIVGIPTAPKFNRIFLCYEDETA